MFSRNVHHLQLSYPFSAADPPRDHGAQYGMAKRQMGPPPLSHPQPVEIDPYNRLSGPYPPWEPVANLASSAGEPTALLSSSMILDKTTAVSPEYGLRNGSRDPFAEWYTGKTQPWIPKGAVPEVCLDDRQPARGFSFTWRNTGNGHPSEIHNRPGHPSDTASIQFGVLPSDSGYGSAIGLENASARGSDVVDHSPEIRGLTGRIPSFQPYGDGGTLRETQEPFSSWHLTSTNPAQFQCKHCNQPARTRSELKKHELRHTKPYLCDKRGCSRTEGFSTSNDLDRHMKSKHPSDCSEELLAKTYNCLVNGCKSKDKKWPRLDNFRNHLKRIHRLSESEIEDYVRRVETERKTREDQFSQETLSNIQKTVDQEQLPCIESPDGPDLPFEVSDSNWNNLGSAVLDPQPDLIDPALQDDATEARGMSTKDFHFGFNNKLEKPDSLAGEKALDEANNPDGCLEGERTFQPGQMSIETLTSPATYLVGSKLSAAKAKTSNETGKGSKTQNLLKFDPNLRDVIITAVLSQDSSVNHAGLGQVSKTHPEAELSAMLHCPRSSLVKIDFTLPMPSSEAPSATNLNDQVPCPEALQTLDTNKKDPIDAEQKFQEILKAIQNAGYTIKKDTKSVGLKQSTDQPKSGPAKKRDLVTCLLCSKFRGRPCEYRKHMKRHNRPYGCTFSGCHKTFGSKNDWKRHENSQHYQHETWLCDEETSGKICGKVFYTVDSARSHFTKLHKIEEPEVLERKIAARRIGPNNQQTFWCGFCKKIVDVSQNGDDSWTERYNHIDDHFMGRNKQPKQSILHWKAEKEDDEEAQKDFSSQGENEKSSPESSSSSTSSDKLSGYSNASEENSNQDTSSTTLDTRKRKGTYSNAPGQRPAKQARSSKVETRIICCECEQHYNPKTDTECSVDEHRFCDRCRTVPVRLDPQAY